MICRYRARCFSDWARNEWIPEIALSLLRPYLVNIHKFFCGVLGVLVQWYKFDIRWISGFVSEWSLDGVKIVRSNGHKLATPT